MALRAWDALRSALCHVSPYSQWSARDWVAHYTPHATSAGGGVWDAHGRRIPSHVAGAGESFTQAAEHLLERGQQAFQSATHGASQIAHEGIQAATAPKTLLFGLAAIGILAWVVVQTGRTAERTVVGAAPHVAKALPLLL